MDGGRGWKGGRQEMGITGLTFKNRDTGMTTTVRLTGRYRTHEFWAITRNHRTGEWLIQRAGRQGLGTAYDPPLPGHSGFKTKKAAQAFKKENLK